ncbi:c-type cytochrome [Caballeronia humi]|uniref:Cytochrome c family protein n=1 Tax=Caballeronia humi TaxID=326474 RepID=A0A158HQB7_9BURK|nr:c-type cytochrome [Caballeronia humi]SAL46506.1 cytochrome c family protein [Caballeronia humi]
MNRLYKSLMVLQVAATFGGLAVSGQAAEPAQPAKPDLNRGQAIATQVCAACHAADGNSAGAAFPKLAGQHAEYIVKQLKDYKTQPGAKAPARNNPIMAGIAGALSDQDAVNVAAYFAAQKTKPGFARNKNDVALGQKIYRGGIADKGVPACAACHGAAGMGIPVQYPRLSWQWGDYTAAQLTAFAQGTRNNSETMHTISLRLTDAEIKAVSDYIAGLH